MNCHRYIIIPLEVPYGLRHNSFFAYLILCNDLSGQMLKQTFFLLSRTLELFVVFVVDLSIPRIRVALYAIVLMALHILLFGSLQF